MYKRLDKNKRNCITIHDYKAAISKRAEAWSGVQLAGDIPLKEAY